jgi:hypothetical protein
VSGEWLFVRNASLEGKLVIHFDSLMELDGKLYASHSNYGTNPMTRSVEIWDVDAMQHIAPIVLVLIEGHSLGSTAIRAIGGVPLLTIIKKNRASHTARPGIQNS